MTEPIEEPRRLREVLDALAASSDQLRDLVTPLDDATLARGAYPSDWSIADVMSHVGSGAEIMRRRLDDARLGRSTPDDFAPSVWDEWNAKSDRAKADDGLRADRALMDTLEQVVDAGDTALEFSMGPMSFGLTEFVGLRLNEHVLHTWDIAVALDPNASLSSAPTQLAIDNLSLIARFTGRGTGEQRTIRVRTTGPARAFVVALTPDGASYAEDDGRQAPDVTLPAEAWIRLIYGRLDADHTPPFEGDAAAVGTLRTVFPGP